VSKTIIPSERSYDIQISINGNIVGGQSNATVDQVMKPINITNKITGEWEKSIAGVRSWKVSCSGIKIKGAAAFTALQNAFNNGTEVVIEFTNGSTSFKGNALITSFPFVSEYSDALLYKVTFYGNGEFLKD